MRPVQKGMRHLLQRLGPPSPAMIVALIALFVALGSGAYAAATLPHDSVGTQQLKNGAVTASKLHNGAFTAAKVAYGTLLAKDFKEGQLPAGAPGLKGNTGLQGPKGNAGVQGLNGNAGPQGPAGSAGATGPTGSVGLLKVATSSQPLSVGAGTEGEATAKCNSNEVVTGGGYTLTGEFEVLTSETAEADTAWKIKVKAKSATSGNIEAVCAHIE